MAQINVVIASLDKINPESITTVGAREIRNVRNTLEATRRAGKGKGYFLLNDDMRGGIGVIDAVSASFDKELAVEYKLLYILVLAAVKTCQVHVGKG